MDKRSMGMRVFRLSHRDRGPLPSPPEKGETVQYHSRRVHLKSRYGCKGCRERRRKCDEARPKCSLCVRRDISCEYENGPKSRSALGGSGAELALQHSTTQLSPSIWPGAYSPKVLVDAGSAVEIQHTNYDLYLIDHFIKSTAHSWQSPQHAEVYTTGAFELAKEYPYVMHAMISVAACHLQHLGIDAKRYRLPESFHCHFASRGLRQSIATFASKQHSDAVLTTAMLLNVLCYCAADYRDQEPLSPLGSHSPRWDWFRIQIGITDLLIRTRPFHPQSIWRFLLARPPSFDLGTTPESDLGAQLALFCGLDENSSSDNSVYSEPVRLLTPVVERPPNPALSPLYIECVGTMTPAFVDLLEAHDTRALLLFAHWLALMCSIDQWWSRRRTTRECWAICDILVKQMRAEDLHLLERPAKACGYPLYLGDGEMLMDILNLETVAFKEAEGR